MRKVSYVARGGLGIVTPRYTTVFGIDDSAKPMGVYDRPPRRIPPVLRLLKEHVERRTGATFNFCLVNFYQDGSDSISFVFPSFFLPAPPSRLMKIVDIILMARS